MKTYTITIMLCLVAWGVWAQQPVAKDCYLSGTLTSADKTQAIAFAAVKVLEQDSSLLYGLISDAEGQFCLPKSAMRYGKWLQIEAIGYKPAIWELSSMPRSAVLHLQPAITALQEVEIAEEQSGYKTMVDKTVVIPDSLMLIGAHNTMGLAKKIPLLKVDRSTQSISVQGANNTLILVNGNYSGANLNPAQIAASNIERIEIVSSPSAQYDSEVGAVINIITKREAEEGFTGFVFLNYFLKNKQNTSNFKLSYNWKKINAFVAYNARLSQVGTSSTTYSRRQTAAGEYESYQESPLVDNPKLMQHKIRYGIEYRIDPKNLLSVDANYVFSDNKDKQHTYTKTYLNKVLQSNIAGIYNRKDKSQYQNYALYYRHLFAKKGHKLRVHLNTFIMQRDKDITNTSSYFHKDTLLHTSEVNSLTKYDANSMRLRSDYSLPINKIWTWESGYHAYRRAVENKRLISDNQLFSYTGWRHALYGQMSAKQGRWSGQIGLRAEGQWTSIGAAHNNYWSFLPNASALYKRNNHHVKALYRRRLSYPYIGSLTPFEFYSPDSLKVSRGNPYLKPAKIDKIELSYSYQKPPKAFFSCNVYAQWMHDMIRTAYKTLPGGVLESSAQNVGQMQRFGSVLSAQYLLLYTFGFGAYYHFSYYQFPEKEYNGFSNQLSLSFETPLPGGILAGISYTMGGKTYNYRGWDYSYPIYDEIFVSKEIFDGYGEINVSFLNVFKPEKDKSKTWDPTFLELNYTNYDSYKVMISFSYYFKRGQTRRMQRRANMMESDVGGE